MIGSDLFVINDDGWSLQLNDGAKTELSENL